MKLTIIIPVYNEINTINILLKKVIEVGIDKQIIVVDDFSSDGTREIIIKNFENKIDKLILHEKNLGKGAAIISAKKYINGDFVIIQDADLEYDPNQYILFLNELKKKKIDALYGSRVLKKDNIQTYKISVIKLGFEIFFNIYFKSN